MVGSGDRGNVHTALILVLEDDDALGRGLTRALKNDGYDVVLCRTLAEAADVAVTAIDVALVDITLPDGLGTTYVANLRRMRPEVPAIIMTGAPSIETAVDAVREKAFDYLIKPVALDAVRLVIRRSIEATRLRDEVVFLRETLSQVNSRLLGNSATMRRLRGTVATLAPAPTTVLIQGETGTGKELVARALHDDGARKGAFIAFNCAALPETLLEAELFGHKKGAFTGAADDRDGLVAAAENGTLFLDEIGEMPYALQAKLLTLLQTRRYRPLGDVREVVAEVRIVAATNRDLANEAREKRFREDLFWRLAVVVLTVPALRERIEDIEELTLHFISRHSARLGKKVTGLSRPALEKLVSHSWPGNVRELENVIERAILLGRGEVIEKDDIEIMHFRRSEGPLTRRVESFAKEQLIQLLDEHGGNVTRAAKAAGRNRSSFYTLLKKHGIGKK